MELQTHRNNLREIRVVSFSVKKRKFLTRKYTFNKNPKLVDFQTCYDLITLARERGIQNLGNITKAEMCEALNIVMKPRVKQVRKWVKKIPIHTCAEKPTEIKACSIYVLKQMGRAEGVRYGGSMNKKQLCAALNVVFKI